MKDIITVIYKELKCLAGSGKGTFVIYALISVVWSLMLLSNINADADADVLVFAANSLWFVFFSVIVTANFASSALISERVSGALEILITSGVSRNAVLFGKMFFIVMMTSAMGAVCVALAAVWAIVLPEADFSKTLGVYDALLYLSATILNAAASAYLSVRMSNPRFLHFINLFMIAGFLAICEAVSAFVVADLNAYMLVLGFLFAGGAFTLLAKREFNGERITRPVVF